MTGPTYVDVPLPDSVVLPKLAKPRKVAAEEVKAAAEDFVQRFNTATEQSDAALFQDLIAEGGYWRDVISFTTDYRNIAKANVLQAATDRLELTKAKGATLIDPAPVLEEPFDGLQWIILFFKFETKIGPAVGVARIALETDGVWRAWSLFTALTGIHQQKDMFGPGRPRGRHNSSKSYDELREEEVNDPHPDVLIVGAGHNGLQIGAYLKKHGVNALIVDKNERVGDNWRLRYRSLSLHDAVWSNHLAFMPFPENWPIYTPAGKLANWLEHYAEVMELNVWTSSTMVPEETHFDESRNEWKVTIDRKGQRHVFHVSHVVLATGFGGGTPKMPSPFPGQEKFRNKIVHSSAHQGGTEYKGKKALVVGACTSGHDISVDFFNNGADVTMLQRSPTFVMSVEKGIPILNKTYYEGGPPVDIADLLTESMPRTLTRAAHRNHVVPQIAQVDAELLEGLRKAGFKTYSGSDGSGCMFLSLEKCGGYYFDTGASGRIISGDIKVKSGSIKGFTDTGVVFDDGSTEDYDVVVFATGYTGYDDQVRTTLGDEYAKKMGAVWNLNEEQELNGVYRDCGIPNTYYMVANLAWSRFNAKMLALQLVAERLGVLDERYTLERQRNGA